MPAFFAYRSPYDSPLGKHACRLSTDSVLEWFRRNWACAGTSASEDEQHQRAEAWLRDELDCDPYGLTSLFTAAARDGLAPPRSEADLFELLQEHLYVEGDKQEQLLCRPGSIQVYTDDDNLDVAYYFCDDAFLKDHGRLAAFLLHEPWRLPAACQVGSFRSGCPYREVATGLGGEGGTYLVVTRECGKCEFGTLAERPPALLPGVRLPALPSCLRATTPAADWPEELVLLWSQLPDEGELSDDGLRDALDRVHWFPVAVFEHLPDARTLSRKEAHTMLWDRRRTMMHEKYRTNSLLSRVASSGHLAQLCWCVANAPTWAFGRNVYNQWYLFDDLWASGNPDLAAGILRFATRWDVLTPEGKEAGSSWR
jgi:hypothetical protein